MASATPVLPEVGSPIVPPRDSNPRLSASAIMDRPIRSFRLPPGLNHSSLAKIRPAPPEKRGSSTSGVSPIDSSSASPRRIVVVEEELKEYLLADDSKKKPRHSRGFGMRKKTSVGLLRAARRVALAAVDRLAVGRVERDLRLLAAAVAGHIVERPFASLSRGGLALVATGLATLGLVGESLAGVELLVVGRKKERAATVHAGEVLVRILLHHGSYRSPGFSPPGFFPVQKVSTGIYEGIMAPPIAAAPKEGSLGPTPFRA